MGKPKVTINCVANHYAAPRERIIEVSGPNGSGCLVSIMDTGDGLRLRVYRRESCEVGVAESGENIG